MLKRRETCRICGSPLRDIFNLGLNYLPVYINDNVPLITRKVPLVLSRCDTSFENSCGLVQLRHTTPPYLLYKHYFYRSAINERMVKHIQKVAKNAIAFIGAKNDEIIVDIGCNDGTLLKYYKEQGFKTVYGFDPARNMLQFSKASGAIVIDDYFRGCVSNNIKLITSLAMFYDLEDPCSFVKDIKRSLKQDGLWVTEQAYLPNTLDKNSFDTICHEHLEYYSFLVFENLIESHDLEVVDVFLNDVNGGSFLVYVAHKGMIRINDDAYERISKLRINEFNMALDTNKPYDEFMERVEKNKSELNNLLSGLYKRGKKIFAYGASTKGAITLQYYGITNELIEACADRNPAKWGLTIIGSEIPIISEKEARVRKPDYFLVLPWHFIDGFIEREKEFLAEGGKFIVPMPTVKVIGSE